MPESSPGLTRGGGGEKKATAKAKAVRKKADQKEQLPANGLNLRAKPEKGAKNPGKSAQKGARGRKGGGGIKGGKKTLTEKNLFSEQCSGPSIYSLTWPTSRKQEARKT